MLDGNALGWGWVWLAQKIYLLHFSNSIIVEDLMLFFINEIIHIYRLDSRPNLDIYRKLRSF